MVAKVHLAYDSVKANSIKDQVVFSMEKNRGGPPLIDLDFREDFPQNLLEPMGSRVAECFVPRAFPRGLDASGVGRHGALHFGLLRVGSFQQPEVPRGLQKGVMDLTGVGDLLFS